MNGRDTATTFSGGAPKLLGLHMTPQEQEAPAGVYGWLVSPPIPMPQVSRSAAIASVTRVSAPCVTLNASPGAADRDIRR